MIRYARIIGVKFDVCCADTWASYFKKYIGHSINGMGFQIGV